MILTIVKRSLSDKISVVMSTVLAFVLSALGVLGFYFSLVRDGDRFYFVPREKFCKEIRTIARRDLRGETEIRQETFERCLALIEAFLANNILLRAAEELVCPRCDKLVAYAARRRKKRYFRDEGEI